MGFFILTVYCLKEVSTAVLFLASWSRHDKSVCIQESMGGCNRDATRRQKNHMPKAANEQPRLKES